MKRAAIRWARRLLVLGAGLAVLAAVVHLPQVRALVLGRLLIACGQDAHVVLGVDRRHGGFAAHAWVECGGRALGHDPGGAFRFETICRITRDGAVVTGAAS